MSIQIAPSILSADFSNLGLEVERIARTADWVHIDVMDNHFVPNLTLGLPIVESLVKAAAVPLDCHLMIDDPDRWAPGYAEVGARSVTFHVEAARDPVRLARTLRSLGARVGLAVKPDTSIDGLTHLLPEIDTLLLMTVEPGFGGQEFLERVLPKIRQARQLLRQHQPSIWLQVDGGISETTIERAASAGADVFVAGSAVYRSEDPSGVIERLRSLAVNASR